MMSQYRLAVMRFFKKIAILIEKTNNTQGESDCSLGEFSKVEIGTRVYRIINMKYYQ